jgi:hypothetical protein
MNMKKSFSIIALVAVLILSVLKAGAAGTSSLDAAGYIRDWLMLAPIQLPEGGAAGDFLLREQVKDEANLKPRAGDKVKVNGKELTWRNITISTNFFDFNATLDSLNDRAAGYMVTYIECDQDIPGVIMSVGSNDQGRIYFNGVDIYAYTDARPLEIDGDKGRITLKKGLNVIVFKIINEQNNWQGSMRLTDEDGAPLKGIQLKRSP